MEQGHSIRDEPVGLFPKPDHRQKEEASRGVSVGEEAGEGLSEAADGLGLGLVVGQASS